MSKFKEYIKQDIDTFINLEEFGEEHVLDGEKISMIIDESSYEDRESTPKEIYNATFGIYQSKITIYLRSTDYEKPSFGQQITFDGEYYYVQGVSDHGGILEISFSANEA